MDAKVFIHLAFEYSIVWMVLRENILNKKVVKKILNMHYKISSKFKCFSHDIHPLLRPVFAFQIFIF